MMNSYCIRKNILLLLRWRYSPGWALASFTIRLQACQSLALSLHSFIPIFLRSVDTSSSHLICGLPLRLVAYSFLHKFETHRGLDYWNKLRKVHLVGPYYASISRCTVYWKWKVHQVWGNFGASGPCLESMHMLQYIASDKYYSLTSLTPSVDRQAYLFCYELWTLWETGFCLDICIILKNQQFGQLLFMLL